MFRFAAQLDGGEIPGEECEEASEALDFTDGETNKPDDGDIGKGVDFEVALRENEEFLLHFLKNPTTDAIEKITEKAKTHFIYMQGKACFTILKSIITLDPEEIEEAMSACQESLDACNESRRKTSFLATIFWKPDVNDYTDEEVHAELGYAETCIMMALLICLTERTIIGLVKAGFRIQLSMSAFNECRRILKFRTKYCSEDSKSHFESGVRMGVGGFNLITSHLPERILRLVSFMGMGGNRSYGMKQLEKAANMERGVRVPLAGMGLVAYNLKVEFLLGLGEVDFEHVQKLMKVLSTRIEGSAILDVFDGLYADAKGRPKEAIQCYLKAQEKSGKVWPEVHYGAYWMLLWDYAVQRDWEKCIYYCKQLLDKCRWSPATFTYMYAMFLYMINEEEMKEEVKADIAKMMRDVPNLRHRIAGKTVHLEKFVEMRSYLYFKENETLLLPILELFYLWNIFPMLQSSPEYLQPFLNDVEEQLKIYTKDSEEQKHRYYNCIFMKGVCLRYLGSFFDAIRSFREVIACETEIINYTHIPPHSALELGLVYRTIGQYAEAKVWLNRAVNDYTGYMNATTVHIRAHTALSSIRIDEEATEASEAAFEQAFDSNFGEKSNFNENSVSQGMEMAKDLEVEDC